MKNCKNSYLDIIFETNQVDKEKRIEIEMDSKHIDLG